MVLAMTRIQDYKLGFISQVIGAALVISCFLGCEADGTGISSEPERSPDEVSTPTSTNVDSDSALDEEIVLSGDSGDPEGSEYCDYQVGWAKGIKGGLGGEVVKVTTLELTGPGSLADALEKDIPKTVVFEVGGVIDLKKQTLRITTPNTTVAGQTAPEPGITLINGSLIIENTHDVVVQHLRVRPGQDDRGKGWDPDGISIEASHNVVIDHCSISWAIDENLSVSGPRFEGGDPEEWRNNTSHSISLTNNIVAEALDNSTHPEGRHSKGSLIHDNTSDVQVIGNLYVSNADRNPLFKGGARGVIANNLIVNPRRYGITYELLEKEWGTLPHQVGLLSIVGNVLQGGEDTDESDSALFSSGYGPVVVYLNDNHAQDFGNAPAKTISEEKFSQVTKISVAPTWPPELTPIPGSETTEQVLSNAGSHPWARDAIDTRIIQSVRDLTTTIIDHEQEVGGLPATSPTTQKFNHAIWNKCFDKINENPN